jgi:SAM-dependent methyltransferase
MSEAQHSFEFVLNVRTQYVGHVTFPCLPAAAGLYLLRLDDMFRLMGRALNSDERLQLAETLKNFLRMGYARAGDANLRIDYEIHPDRSLKRNLAIRMTLSTPDLATQFKTWNSGADDHPFGKHPDARVTAVVRALPVPTPVLEIGGGTGRNALPIARLGYPVDVVELTEEFSRAMIRRAEAERLPIQVRWGNALDESLELPVGHYGLMFASEVVSHFRFDGSLRRFLERGVRALRPGGLLLFNIFLPLPESEYVPDALARQISELAWSTLFSREDLQLALRGLPLRWLSEESVCDYERQHLPPGAWPPTPWFEAWSRGISMFPRLDNPPVGFRWVLLERE